MRREATELGEGYITLKAREGSLPLPQTELVSLILSDADGFVADMDALEIVCDKLKTRIIIVNILTYLLIYITYSAPGNKLLFFL